MHVVRVILCHNGESKSLQVACNQWRIKSQPSKRSPILRTFLNSGQVQKTHWICTINWKLLMISKQKETLGSNKSYFGRNFVWKIDVSCGVSEWFYFCVTDHGGNINAPLGWKLFIVCWLSTFRNWDPAPRYLANKRMASLAPYMTWSGQPASGLSWILADVQMFFICPWNCRCSLKLIDGPITTRCLWYHSDRQQDNIHLRQQIKSLMVLQSKKFIQKEGWGRWCSRIPGLIFYSASYHRWQWATWTYANPEGHCLIYCQDGRLCHVLAMRPSLLITWPEIWACEFARASRQQHQSYTHTLVAEVNLVPMKHSLKHKFMYAVVVGLL